MLKLKLVLNPVKYKMKLFTKVINGLKAIAHNVHKKMHLVFKLKLLLLVL